MRAFKSFHRDGYFESAHIHLCMYMHKHTRRTLIYSFFKIHLWFFECINTMGRVGMPQMEKARAGEKINKRHLIN